MDWLSGNALQDVLANAALFVLPSDLEGLFLALLDAMSAGVCVLGSDTPESLEALGDTGFTFKRGNVADLRRMLTYQLDNDQLRAKFGGRAQERVRENFLWDDVVGELAGIHARMVSRDEKRATIASRLSPSVASVIEIGRPSTNYKAHEGKPMEPAVDQEMPRSVRAAR